MAANGSNPEPEEELFPPAAPGGVPLNLSNPDIDNICQWMFEGLARRDEVLDRLGTELKPQQALQMAVNDSNFNRMLLISLVRYLKKMKDDKRIVIPH